MMSHLWSILLALTIGLRRKDELPETYWRTICHTLSVAVCWVFVFNFNCAELGWAMKWLDIIVIKLMRWRIRKGWGANCDVMDYNDVLHGRGSRQLNSPSRCGSCQGKEVIIWLDNWEDLL